MCNYSGSDVVFMAKRIGVFGGSFNPLHIGHLIVAEAAWQEFNLEQVVFVPTGDTPHKNMHHISKIDRFEMVKMAIKENPHFSISSIEIERKVFLIRWILLSSYTLNGEVNMIYISSPERMPSLICQRGSIMRNYLIPVTLFVQAAQVLKKG